MANFLSNFSASNSWIQGEVQKDKYGQYKLKYADREVRLTQDPFPLYPGELLSGRVTKLSVVKQDQERLIIYAWNFKKWRFWAACKIYWSFIPMTKTTKRLIGWLRMKTLPILMVPKEWPVMSGFWSVPVLTFREKKSTLSIQSLLLSFLLVQFRVLRVFILRILG